MTRDDQLRRAIGHYFQGLYACDVESLDAVFHPAASLFDVDEGGAVRVDPYPEWREVVAARRSPQSAGQARHERVMSVVWLSADVATVQVQLQVLDEIFVDHLTFAWNGSVFQIVAKTWHLERTLAAESPHARADGSAGAERESIVT